MASDIPDQMLACQVIEYNKPYKIHQIPVPKSLGPTDILVKIAVASYCHTDSMVSAGDFFTKLPCIGSHEGAGAVVALGSDVKNLQIGDRVMCGIPTHFCGHCHDCLGPETFRQYCRNLGGHTGVTRDGCFAEYALVDSVTSAKLPDEVSFETAAPLACAGCTVFRGVVLSGLHAGESLAIIGSGGGLGHLGVQFAKAFGMKVIGIDARDEGLALTEKAGADVVIDARKGDEAAVEEVKKVTGGMGVDATVNVSDAKTAAATACAVTKMHGLVIQIAQPARVCVPFRELVFRDIRIHGSVICSPEESGQMLDVVAKHKVWVAKNPFNGLHEIPKLVELVHSGEMTGKGQIIVDPKQIEEQRKAGIQLV